jgi:hypothetical protein
MITKPNGNSDGPQLPNWLRDVWFEFVYVTREIATQWLERNTNNRRIRRGKVAVLKHEMESGTYWTIPDGVAFDRDLKLINSQHRLVAIKESGVAQWMVVSYGWHPDTVFGIDRVTVRQHADNLKLAGHGDLLGSDPCRAEATVKRVVVGSTRSKGELTATELRHALESYQDGLRFAFEAFAGKPHDRGVYIAPVIAAVVRAFYHADRERLAQFVSVLTTAEMESPRDQAAIALLKYLKESEYGRNSNFQGEVYGKTTRAIKSFLIGERLARIYEPSDDLFPLPNVGPAPQRRPVGGVPLLGMFDADRGRAHPTSSH